MASFKYEKMVTIFSLSYDKINEEDRNKERTRRRRRRERKRKSQRERERVI